MGLHSGFGQSTACGGTGGKHTSTPRSHPGSTGREGSDPIPGLRCGGAAVRHPVPRISPPRARGRDHGNLSAIDGSGATTVEGTPKKGREAVSKDSSTTVSATRDSRGREARLGRDGVSPLRRGTWCAHKEALAHQSWVAGVGGLCERNAALSPDRDWVSTRLPHPEEQGCRAPSGRPRGRGPEGGEGGRFPGGLVPLEAFDWAQPSGPKSAEIAGGAGRWPRGSRTRGWGAKQCATSGLPSSMGRRGCRRER